MATKKIGGSPLKRVLNRSLTWKETYNVVAETLTRGDGYSVADPESKAIDNKYAATLKAFESIPEFPDEWAELQRRYLKLAADMRMLEDAPVKADETKRNAHALLIDAAATDATALARDVRARHVEDADVSTKALVATCGELRALLERVAKGNPDIEEDLAYAKGLEPAIKDLRERVSALDLLTNAHPLIAEFMLSRGKALAKPVGDLLEDAKAEVKRYDATLAAAPKQWADLLNDVAKTPRPPAKKDYPRHYQNDARKMDEAKLGFESACEGLAEREGEISKLLADENGHFSAPGFDALRQTIHRIAAMDKERRAALLQANERERQQKKQAVVTAAKEEEERPPERPVALPVRPRGEHAGRTIEILNPGLAPSSVLTGSEQGKVNTFLGLNGQVVAHRIRDTMNENFGNFEAVNHLTVRLSKRRRLEFDIDTSVADRVRVTIVNIGDPTYEH